MEGDLLKIFLPTALSFFIGISLTPFLTRYLYKNKAWKKKAGKLDSLGNEAVVFNQIHKEKETGTPRLGGVIIWTSTLFTAILLWTLAQIWPESTTLNKLDFLSRNQTWIPLATLLLGAIVGMLDDLLEIRGGGGHFAGGLSLKKRLLAVLLTGILVGFWFYDKLEISSVSIPFLGYLDMGTWFVLFVALVMLVIYSGGVIDGIDGLAGGIFAIAFSSYTAIALFQNQLNLAAFCAVVTGGILSFLWFNVPPARFYMSETGSMALTMTLTVVAFMTDKLGEGKGIAVLPIIAFPLLATTCSNVLQLVSKKIRGKKLFLIAPLHHHFEALGWPAYKVTMRYWILSVICGIIGISVALLS